jgi:hypothetical protein
MRKALAVTAALVAVLSLALAARAQSASPATFFAPLDTAQEAPSCAPAVASGAVGSALLEVVDPVAGTVRYRLTASNLPEPPGAAHIHDGPVGVPGGVVEPLPLNGASSGVIGEGTFTNPGLLASMQADPARYYVNVHTPVLCGPGAIRGQLAASQRLLLPAIFRQTEPGAGG